MPLGVFAQASALTKELLLVRGPREIGKMQFFGFMSLKLNIIRYILVFGGRGLFDEHGGSPSLCEASALHSMTVEG